jgi:hypothetical protein
VSEKMSEDENINETEEKTIVDEGDIDNEKSNIEKLGLNDLSNQGFSRLMEGRKPKDENCEKKKPFMF